MLTEKKQNKLEKILGPDIIKELEALSVNDLDTKIATLV